MGWCGKGFPIRAIMALMIFFIACNSYMLRASLSFTIIDMVSPEFVYLDTKCEISDTNSSRQHPVSSLHSRNEKYITWDRTEQSHILSVYFSGYTLSQIFGSRLARLLGGKIIVGWGMLLAAFTTLLFPFAAKSDFTCAMMVRFLMGLFSGTVFPAMHVCISKWAPPKEMPFFIWCLLGGNIGVALTWPMCAALVAYYGWESVFHATSAIAVYWSFLWITVATEDPTTYRKIEKSELEYITSNIKTTRSKPKTQSVPWLGMCVSPPVLALAILHFGAMWGAHFALLEGPFYFRQVLGYGPIMGSVFAGLLLGNRLAFGLLFNVLTGVLCRWRIATTASLRKTSVLVSHVAPGALLALAAAALCACPVAATVLPLAALALSGAAMGGALAAARDLSTHFAESLTSVLNIVGASSGIAVPLITGTIVADENSGLRWRLALSVTAAVYVASGCLFLLMGESKRQSWDFVGDAADEDAVAGPTARPDEGPQPSTSHSISAENGTVLPSDVSPGPTK